MHNISLEGDWAIEIVCGEGNWATWAEGKFLWCGFYFAVLEHVKCIPYLKLSKYNKDHIWQTYSQHHTQRAKTKSFPPKIRHKTRLFTFTTSIQHSIGSSSHTNQMGKGNKSYPNWKGGNKTAVVLRWHDNPIDSTKKMTDLISEFVK